MIFDSYAPMTYVHSFLRADKKFLLQVKVLRLLFAVQNDRVGDIMIHENYSVIHQLFLKGEYVQFKSTLSFLSFSQKNEFKLSVEQVCRHSTLHFLRVHTMYI